MRRHRRKNGLKRKAQRKKKKNAGQTTGLLCKPRGKGNRKDSHGDKRKENMPAPILLFQETQKNNGTGKITYSGGGEENFAGHLNQKKNKIGTNTTD